MKNFLYLPIIAFFLNIDNADAQAILQWAHNFGSENIYATDEALNVAVDNENNIYVTGFFTDTVDFDPGPGTSSYFFSTSSSHPAGFLAKYNPAGEFIWVIAVGNPGGGIRGSSIAFDSEGNVIWTGAVNGTVDFDPGPDNHSFGGSASYNTLFVAKYNSDGMYLNAFAISGIANSVGKQVIVDTDDNILVIGSFQGTLDFDPSAAVSSITAVNAGGDLFFAKYSSAGDFILVKNINATPTNDNFDYGNFAALDEDGNLFVAGKFDETTDFDPGPGVAELTATVRDVFFAKYDKDINLVWVKQLVGEDQGVCHALALDADKNIYLAGWFRIGMDMDPGAGVSTIEAEQYESDNIFFAKYSNSGELVWAHAMGGQSYDYATSLLVDPSGLVYLCGDFYNEVDFDPGVGTAVLSNQVDAQDGFLAVYDNNGNYLSASQVKGEAFSNNRPMGMQLDHSGDLVLSGWFSTTADFDCTGGVYNLTSGGDYDIYLAKYDSIVFSTVGIDEPAEGEYSIFPNPADKYLMIDLLVMSGVVSDVYVTDLTGRIVLKMIPDEIAGSHHLEINTSSLIPSTYLLVLKTPEKIQTRKFIVQH